MTLTIQDHALRYPLKVKPVRPAAPYQGGKKILAPQIIARINAAPHTIYAEPFVGMGGVFFRRNRIPKAEVINDLNGDVTNFFRILQRHHSPFMDMIRFQLTSRNEFDRLGAIDPATLTDLERAVRFFYLQKTTFGGKLVGRVFGIDTATGARFNVTRIAPVLEKIHARLTGVAIECLPFEEFIERYDRKGVLFYLDPPYWGTEHYYGDGLFGRQDFEVIADLLANLKGRFILSLNDIAPVRRLFAGYKIEQTDVIYQMFGKPPKRDRELIISGP
jgi:DNA adenine methylase